MKLNKLAIAASFALLTGSGLANAVAVDLTGWTAEGPQHSRNVQAGNDTVLQTVNGRPTVFFDPTVTSTQGNALSGKITVTTSGDDDFIGFVLGYNSGELLPSSADYYLVDWKQGDQNPAVDGMALSRVTDGSVDNNFWQHVSGVTELERAATLGSTGWNDFQEYDFNIIFTSSLVEVSVDGVLQISVTASDAGLTSFVDGSFGFYNYSQSNVLYSSIVQVDCSQTPNDPSCQTSTDPIPSVPEPGTLVLLELGMLGLGASRRRKA
ncbi:MAG: PEP-CTERM sorting domain-containing protein [Motiliproteus sp.]